MSALGQAEHLLNLRLGLEDEVFRRAAAKDDDRAAARFLGSVHDRRALIYVAERVDPQCAAFQLERGEIHADGAVAWRRREDRHTKAIGRRQHTLAAPADLVLARSQVFANEVVELRGSHDPLKGVAAAQRSVKLVRAEQVLVVKDDVVDADHLVLAQLQIVEPGARLMHVHAQGKMGVVIEIRARADNPINETRLEQRDQTRDAKPCGRQGATKRKTHRRVVRKDFRGEQAAGFAQAAGVVRKKGFVDELRDADRGRERGGIDLLVADAVQILAASALHERPL